MINSIDHYFVLPCWSNVFHLLDICNLMLHIYCRRGIKLGEHPRVEWQLQRNKIEDLKIIHKLFFGVFGDVRF